MAFVFTFIRAFVRACVYLNFVFNFLNYFSFSFHVIFFHFFLVFFSSFNVYVCLRQLLRCGPSQPASSWPCVRAEDDGGPYARRGCPHGPTRPRPPTEGAKGRRCGVRTYQHATWRAQSGKGG